MTDAKERLIWHHYAVGAFGVLLLLSIWAVPLRGLVSPISTDTFLTELGSLMGAIFTAGGLVLAIAALFTLATVETKAREVATQVLQQARADIDADLTLALTAYDYLFSARNSINNDNFADLREAERLVEEALRKRPDLPHAREWIAITLFDAAFRYFLIDHFNDNFRGIPIGAGRETDFYTNVHEAIRWLRELVERTSDFDEKTEYQAILARAYGLAGNADDMLRTITEIPEGKRETVFAGRDARLSVASGVRQVPARAPELHALLPTRFPPSTHAIKEAWLSHRGHAPSWDSRFGIWSLRKSPIPSVAPIAQTPGVVWLLPFGENQVVLRWKRDASEFISYPEENDKAPDIDGALKTLEEYFIPICAVEGEVYP